MKGITYALNGFKAAITSEANFRIHLASAFLATLSGWFFEISTIEWVVIILSIGLVISMEMINTAIEILIDYVAPEIHPEAGKIKDIAAGAVLAVAVAAFITGLIIFIPKIAAYLIAFN